LTEVARKVISGVPDDVEKSCGTKIYSGFSGEFW